MSARPGGGVRSAAVATCVAVAILLGLGSWQLQRRAWKAGILAEIDHAERAAPVPLAGVPGRFAKVVAHGVFRAGSSFYGSEVREDAEGRARIGAHLLQLLDRPAGEAPVVVDRGWVAIPGPVPVAVGPAEVVGYARPAEVAGFLSAEDDPDGKHFYTLNPAAIGAALGAARVAPFTLVALGTPMGDGPVPAAALPRPPNNHLQYAFTWFGLAGALVAVFVVWVRGKRAEGG